MAVHLHDAGVSRPKKLDDAAIATFLEGHPGWAREADALVRTYTFERYGDGLGFAVAVGVEADKADHHPDLFIGWRKVRVLWSTHDAGGISSLDVDAAGLADAIAARFAGPSGQPAS
jgi:4a-hydroxytetrahydrobiopterin dehydratase